MSRPDQSDPTPGDAPSVDAIETVIVPKTADIGNLEVKRALPSRQTRMVGPFIFFDQFGPAEFLTGQGLDVRPHPHINLATVTYLLEGEIVHKDSLGTSIAIRPGAVNLMTAGKGIVHSERTGPEKRQSGQRMFGLQTWMALPEGFEEQPPAFAHYSADELPTIDEEGVTARVLAGKALGLVSPLKAASETLYVDMALAPGLTVPIDPDYEERALYTLTGEIEIGGQRFEAGQLLILKAGETVDVRNAGPGPARLMLFGGEPMDGPRYIWWNFVSSRKERIEQAKEE